MKRRWKTLGAGLALLLLTSATLAACGGDEEPAPTAAPTAQSGLVDNADQSKLDLGQAAPAFSLPASDGNTVALADYQDEPVLLFFHMAGG